MIQSLKYCSDLSKKKRVVQGRQALRSGAYILYVSTAEAKRDEVIRSLFKLKVSGGNNGEDTPVPIPNTAVKLSSADGTAVSCGRVGRCQDFLFSRGYLYLAINKLTVLSYHCVRHNISLSD